MLQQGSIVGGRYEIVDLLGGGGMKQVWLARDRRLSGRSCAVAEMIDSFRSDTARTAAATAFRHEAELLASLSSEHIPQVYDSFSEGSAHYLVMEYVRGETLDQKLKTVGRLSEESATSVALQIAETLQYLHSCNPPVIYRDLKPSNVILKPSGHLMLVDFGIARHFRAPTTVTMVGTPGYAAPEQWKGKAEPRSDVYALGALLHQMLSGRDPGAEPPFSFPPLEDLCSECTLEIAALVNDSLITTSGHASRASLHSERDSPKLETQQESANAAVQASRGNDYPYFSASTGVQVAHSLGAAPMEFARWFQGPLRPLSGSQFGTISPHQMRCRQRLSRVKNPVQRLHPNLQSPRPRNPQQPRPVQVVPKFTSASSEGSRVRCALPKRVDMHPRALPPGGVFDISVRADEDQVRNLQSAPTRITANTWWYGTCWVSFSSDGHVAQFAELWKPVAIGDVPKAIAPAMGTPVPSPLPSAARRRPPAGLFHDRLYEERCARDSGHS